MLHRVGESAKPSLQCDTCKAHIENHEDNMVSLENGYKGGGSRQAVMPCNPRVQEGKNNIFETSVHYKRGGKYGSGGALTAKAAAQLLQGSPAHHYREAGEAAASKRQCNQPKFEQILRLQHFWNWSTLLISLACAEPPAAGAFPFLHTRVAVFQHFKKA
eukprot:scaffold57391_cov19-Tisochrysis_lutea.AAC.3